MAALAAAIPAAAQDVAGPPDAPLPGPDEIGRDSVTLGLAAGYMTDYEGSDDYQFLPVPGALGSIGGYAFSVLGNRASVDLVRNQPGPTWDVQAGPVGVVNFLRNRRGAIDDARVAALDKRGIAVELGGYVGIGKTGVVTSPYDKLSLSLSYRYDVAGTHKSGIWQPSINYLTPLSRKTAVGLFASAQRVERRYIRTYYDVTAAESLASGLPVFAGRGGWQSWTVGGMGTVALTGDLLKGFKLVAGGTYRRLLNDTADSPLVRIAGSRNQWLGAVGVAYTF
jgi:outer membrane scaffolding protein for murein synthesis (MipA/OmpV family)